MPSTTRTDDERASVRAQPRTLRLERAAADTPRPTCADLERPPDLSESEICVAASRTIEAARGAELPGRILTRLKDMEWALQILRDPDWKVPPGVRSRILNALYRLANPLELVRDVTPGPGFLDDTIMGALPERGLRREIAGYRNFVRYRRYASRTAARAEKRIEDRRKRLRAQIQEQQDRETQSRRRRFGLVACAWICTAGMLSGACKQAPHLGGSTYLLNERISATPAYDYNVGDSNIMTFSGYDQNAFQMGSINVTRPD